MLQALVKLVAITVGVLTVAFLAVVFVRWMGYQQRFSAPPHPWFKQAEWHILNPSAQQLCGADSTGADVEKLVPNPDWIVTVKTERILKLSDTEWYVPCPTPIKLSDFLKKQTHKNWLVEVLAKDTWSLDNLSDVIQANEKQNQFGIWAESQKVSVYLRKKGPEWLFAADSASLLRFQLFESLWIDTAMDFWPDFVVNGFNGPFHLDERGARELQRREKRIIWDKTHGATVAPAIPLQGEMTRERTGEMTTRPESRANP